MTEVWIDLPDMDGRYQISNHGHLRQIWKKQRCGKQMLLVYTGMSRHAVSDYKTGNMGWYVYLDNERIFIARSVAMKHFQDMPVMLNRQEDEEAIAKAQQTFRPEILQRATS